MASLGLNELMAFCSVITEYKQDIFYRHIACLSMASYYYDMDEQPTHENIKQLHYKSYILYE